jgi:hypothetical protein
MPDMDRPVGIGQSGSYQDFAGNGHERGKRERGPSQEIVEQRPEIREGGGWWKVRAGQKRKGEEGNRRKRRKRREEKKGG